MERNGTRMDDVENNEQVESEETLKLYGHMFADLLKSSRFVEFFELNFDIQKFVDEEAKTIDYRIIEVPPQEAMKRLMKKENDAAKTVQPATVEMMEKLTKKK